jgi:integrase
MLMATWNDGCERTRYPGILRTRTGYRVRVRALDPRTGTLKERNEHFVGITQEEAQRRQAELRDEIRRGGPAVTAAREKYAAFAGRLLSEKIATGKLTSAKSRRTWADAQDLHLIPAFGAYFLDAIKRTDIKQWLTEQARGVPAKYSAHTVNGWLAILLATLRSAVEELDLPYDPTRGIEPLDTSRYPTYTEEEPGALAIDEVPRFLEQARRLYPQHFAMFALGIATGRRPSELRPLRRAGATPDILWDTGELLIRRSETMGIVNDRTKTKRRLRIPLPEDLLAILRWHVDHLPDGPMRESELMFPSTTGAFRAASILDKPIRHIAKAAGITKHLSAKLMRRTFQDLGRAAQVHDFVTRAISGHATSVMQEHYSTVAADEVREGLARVISLAKFKQAHADRGDAAPSGDAGGDVEPENRTALRASSASSAE